MTAACHALIPAAGIGARAGGALPKQYRLVAGAPMLLHVLRAFAAVPAIDRIVVVVAPDDERFAALGVDASIAARLVVVRDGGATRDASVANGLAALAGTVADDDWILVHDAARCGITPDVVDGLIDTLVDDPVGGLLAVRLDDTVKREADGAAAAARPTVAATVDRRGLWRAQTPQMFRYRLLSDALARARDAGFAVTDEASAIEAAGLMARLVPGVATNFKVTTADDLAMMDLLLEGRAAATR